jgi:WD40 repeat protein
MIILVYTLTGHTNQVRTLATLPNGNLASGSIDSSIKIWIPSTGSFFYTLTGNRGSVYSLATLPNGNLASGSLENTIKIWNPNTEYLLFTLIGHTNFVRKLATLYLMVILYLLHLFLFFYFGNLIFNIKATIIFNLIKSCLSI